MLKIKLLSLVIFCCAIWGCSSPSTPCDHFLQRWEEHGYYADTLSAEVGENMCSPANIARYDQYLRTEWRFLNEMFNYCDAEEILEKYPHIIPSGDRAELFLSRFSPNDFCPITDLEESN